MKRIAILAAVFALPALAQTQDEQPEPEGIAPDQPAIVIPDIPANDVRALAGNGVKLKGLDKVSGEVVDLDVSLGETAEVGRLEVTATECRYPEDNLAGEGYAWLTIREPASGTMLFEGWMVASSPALNALDHPRYDVWVIRCTTA